jgi:hypothetical protein
VAQTVVKHYLEPLLDPLFDDDSYGYRPGRSAKDAVRVTRERCWKFDWVLEFDVKGALDRCSPYTFGCCGRVEEIWKGSRYLYSKAFCSSPADVNGFEFAALYTLQDSLSRDAEQVHGFEHFHVTFRRVFNEERTQLLSHADAPRCAGCDLFARDEAIVEPAMQCGRRNAEDLRGTVDGHALGIGVFLGWHKAGDFPVRAQHADAIGRERQPGRGGATLARLSEILCSEPVG